MEYNTSYIQDFSEYDSKIDEVAYYNFLKKRKEKLERILKF